jgi:hypothetical protein
VTMTVSAGIAEIVQALSSGAIPDPFDAAYSNIA